MTKLQDQTRQYWQLSSVWNNPNIKEKLTVVSGIQRLNKLLAEVPARSKLYVRCDILMAEFVMQPHRKRSRKVLPPTSLDVERERKRMRVLSQSELQHKTA